MGRMIARKVKGMNWKAKISLILIFTLMFSTFMYQGWYMPQTVQAAITQPTAWTAQYGATAFPNGAINAAYAVPAGTDRLLVLAVSSTRTAVGTVTCSATYGGVAMTLAASDAAVATTWNHTYLFYMNDTTIGAGAQTKSLNLTCSGGTAYYTRAYAAVFAGVNQSTPLTDSRNYNSGATANTTVGPLNPGLTVNAGDQAVEVVNLARITAGTTARTVTTWATTWNTANGVDSATVVTSGPCMGSYVRNRNVITSGTDTSQHTASNANTWDSMTAMTLKVTSDAVKPTVTGFAATTPTGNISVPITTFTATDNIAVTGYMITTTATPPLAGDAGWVTPAPTFFNVGSAGTYTLYPWAKDAAGNVSNVYGSPVTVVVDGTAPSYTWNTPASGAYVKDGGAISVDAAITETGVGIINGTNCNPKIDGGTFSFTGSVTYSLAQGKCTGTLTLGTPAGLADGAHNLTLQVADSAGNSAQSAARVINIDNTAPNLPSNACPGAYCTAYTPADEATAQPLSVALQSATATDSGSGSVEYSFSVWDTQTYSQNSGWISLTSFSPPGLQYGTTYTWSVMARDAVGNVTNSSTPRSFSTVAQCFRNEPSFNYIGSSIQTVTTDGGTANHTIRITNNDIGGCPNTVFTLSSEETADADDNFINIPTLNGSNPPLLTNSIAPGGYQDITMGVTARAGKTAGRARDRVSAAADANHPTGPFYSATSTTNLNVSTCTANVPQLVVGPDAANVAVGGSVTYSISVRNSDVGAACTSVTYTVSILSENPTTPNVNFNQSTLTYAAQNGQSVTVPLNPGQSGTITLTVSAPTTATIEQIGVTTIGVTASGHTAPANKTATTTVGNRMLHNSINTGSLKWSSVGGWGVPNGKYGEFICNTCHVLDGTTPNIKKVLSAIATPDEVKGLIPGDSAPIVFTRTSGSPTDSGVFGDDSDAPRSSSNRVCEVCHTYNTGTEGVKVHAFNQPAYSIDTDGVTPVSNNHKNYNAKDCTACHAHNIGFKPPTCSTCHGNPPGALATAPFATGSATNGKHATHWGTLGYGCVNCHNNYTMPQESTVKPGFGNISIGFNNFGSTTGTYSGQSNVSYSVNGAAQFLGNGTATCSTVYCHGSTIGGTAATWTGAVVCGDCHKTTAGDPPTLGSHARHAGNGAGQLNLACSDCHGANGAGGAGHVSGKIEWTLNTAVARIGANAKYWGSVSGTVPNLAPSSTYRTCSTTYCHGSATPTWGDVTPLLCNACHGANNNGDLSVTSATGHAIHYGTATLPTSLSQADNFTSGYAYGCASCHPDNQHASGPASANSSANIGGTKMTGGQYTAGGVSSTDPKNFSYTKGTCATNNCHTDGRGGAAKSPVIWDGAKTTPNCGICHNKAGDASPTWTAAHTKHVNTYSENTNITCNSCHSGTAASNTALQATAQARTQHPDSTKNIAFNGWASGAGASWDGTQCSNTYCHSAGTSANAGTHGALTWTTTQGCTACHGGAASWTTSGATAATGTHWKHVVDRGYTCNICHNATASNNTTITTFANHVNKNVTINFGAAWSTTTSAYNGQTAGGASVYQKTVGTTTGTCSTTLCHGGSSKNWGTVSNDAQCVKCHGIAGQSPAQYAADNNIAAPGYWQTGTNTSGASGTFTNGVSNAAKVWAHDSHLRSPSVKGYTTLRGVECSDCHDINAINGNINAAGHMNGVTNFVWSSLVRNVGNNNPKWNTLAIAPWYSSGNQQCGNIYCHGQSATAAGVQGNGWSSLNFNNNQWLTVASAKDSASCNKCHLSPPTRTTNYDHTSLTIASDCSSCHNHNGAGASHIDGTLYGVSTCNNCHWYDTADAGAWTTNTKGNQSGALWNSTNAWGAHAKHIDHLKTRYGASLLATSDTYGNANFNKVCGFCHSNNAGNHITVNTRQITWNTTTHQFSASPLNWNTVSRSCSNLDCHYKASPVW